ncbi:hypothetical protein FO519_009610, partial [Halicephalobus sp. NKZ332]
MARFFYFVVVVFHYCNGQYPQQIRPVNYPGAAGFHGGPAFGGYGFGGPGIGGPGVGVQGLGGHGLGGPNLGHPNLGGSGLGNQVFGGPDLGAPGLGGQRAEGVVQAQPDVAISSLSQPKTVHRTQSQLSTPPKENRNNFEKEILNFQPFKQANGHKARQSPYSGAPMGQISPGLYSGGMMMGNGINGLYQNPVNPYGGGQFGGQVPSGPYSGGVPGVLPGGQITSGPYSGGLSGGQMPLGPYSGGQIAPGPYSGGLSGGQVFPTPYSNVVPGGPTPDDLATGLYSGGNLKEEFFNIPQQNPGGLVPAKFTDNIPLVPSQVQVEKHTNNIKLTQSLGIGNLQGNKTGSLPKFLEGADESVVKKFKQILRQPHVPYAEKLKQVESLVSGLDENRQKLFRQFMEENKVLETQKQGRPSQHQKSRSPTRSGFEEISSILQDEALPEKERWDQVVEIYRRMEPKIENGEEKDVRNNYGVPCCYGCKGFFRRSINEGRSYTCPNGGNCSVLKVGMNENQLRSKSCMKASDVLNLPTPVLINPKSTLTSTLILNSTSDADPCSLNLINFLSSMTKASLESYDPRYYEITLEQWTQLYENCDREISLIEGIKNPGKVCPRTKLDFSKSRPATKEDIAFSWYRLFVAVADWANNIPQFRMLPEADQAHLLRLNFTILSIIVFFHFLFKPDLDLSNVPIGNGSYVNKEHLG